MTPRTVFREDHGQYRDTVRRFVQREIAPFHADWEKADRVPRIYGGTSEIMKEIIARAL